MEGWAFGLHEMFDLWQYPRDPGSPCHVRGWARGVQSPKRNAKDFGSITILRRPLDPLGILYNDLILELLQCWIVIDDRISPKFFFRKLLVVLPFQGPQESGGDFFEFLQHLFVALPGCRIPDQTDEKLRGRGGVNHLQKSWFTKAASSSSSSSSSSSYSSSS